MLAQPGAPAAVTLDSEHQLTIASEDLSPLLQLVIAGRGGLEGELGEHLSEVAECDGVVALLVGVDPDCNHRVLLIVDAVGDAEAVGQSCVRVMFRLL